MVKKRYMEFLNCFVGCKIFESNHNYNESSDISKNMYNHQLQMPDYFSAGIRLFSILFNYSIFFIKGKRFSDNK